MKSRPSFETFIGDKPLYYKEINHERVHLAYELLKPKIRQALTIHVVGTNGKGSTGRIMAILLHESGTKVGHFSSPHILKFNERIWLEGQESSDEELEKAHQKLYEILGQTMSEALSYFEYTTLLAFVAMEKLDVLILEAGLGGEFDATNVCSKALLVITPIGLDHQDFLGESIEEIAQTKLNAMERQVLVGLQVYDEVYDIATDIAKEKDAILYKVDASEHTSLLKITASLGWADYLYENAKLAINALEILNLPYSLEHLEKVTLFGRFYSLFDNVIIDVGHNLLAAKALKKALQKRHNNEKIILIYNTLDDKDYISILREFKDIIKHVEILPIITKRAVNIKCLKESLDNLDITYKEFHNIVNCEKYFVFGSFYVLEAFLSKIKFNIKNK